MLPNQRQVFEPLYKYIYCLCFENSSLLWCYILYRRFEGLQYPRNAQSYLPVYSALHRRLKHSCFRNTTLCRAVYIGNISEEFAAFIFRAVQTLFLDYHEDGKKLLRNNVINTHFSDYRERKQLPLTVTLLNTQSSMQMGRPFIPGHLHM